jgi:hypothetical protein
MTVVMPCAGRKVRHAGYFRTQDGRRVAFVADPASGPPTSDVLYARPDDIADADGRTTWRDLLVRYNLDERERNPFGLLSASELYRPPEYRTLVLALGPANVCILSAGWGLIASTFLTPSYNITLTNQAKPLVRRRRQHRYQDFCQAPASVAGPLVFFGVKDYVPLFVELTRGVLAERIIVHRTAEAPEVAGCRTLRYAEGPPRTWHYLAAADLAAGRLRLS